MFAGGGRCRASERAGNDTQVHLWKTGLGTVSTAQKTKDVVFTSRHLSSVILEPGLLKTTQMN